MRILSIFLAFWMAFAGVSVEPSQDAVMMARLLWGECRGVESRMEQAAVAWCVLNRVDDPRFPDTIKGVITQPSQFTGYDKNHPVDPELLELAMDVIERWQTGADGRTLPAEYVYFVAGSGHHNNFSKVWPVGREVWDWSMEDPYKKGEENADTIDGLDEHDEPADEDDYERGRVLRTRSRHNDALVD